MDSSLPVLVTASYTGIISLWNTSKSEWTIDTEVIPEGTYQEYTINRLCISEDKKNLAAGCTNGLRMYDIKPDRFVQRNFIEEKSNVTSLGFDINNNWVYYATEAGKLNIYDVRASNKSTLFSQEVDINCTALNPNQAEIIFGDAKGNLKVFDVTANKINTTLCVSKNVGIRSLAFSLDASLLAVVDSIGYLRTLTISKAEVLTEMNSKKIHDDYILNVRISNDKKYLITSSADKTIKVFELMDKNVIKEDKTLFGHTKWVWDIDALSDSKHLLSVSTDGFLKCWRIDNGCLVKEYYNAYRVSSDGKKHLKKGFVAVAVKDRKI